MDEKLKQELQQIGLRYFEIELYAALIAKGPRSISQLARELKLHRPAIYKLLKTLRKMGLIAPQVKSWGRFVEAEPPEEVLLSIRGHKQKIQSLETHFLEALPSISADYDKNLFSPKIRFYKGKEGLIAAYHRTLVEASKEILFYGNASLFIRLVGDAQEYEWREIRIAKKLSTRLLALKDDMAENLKINDEKELRKTKFLDMPKFGSFYMLSGGTIILLDLMLPLALAVKDKPLADMFRENFEALWKAHA